MDIRDCIQLGMAVCDMHYGVARKLPSGIEVEVENYTTFKPMFGENHPAHRMVKIALDGLVDYPDNKIAYCAGFRGDHAVCVFSYDGKRFGQFELKLKGE